MQVRGLIYHDWLWFTLHITLIYSVVPTVATSGDGLYLFRIKVWIYIWKLQSFAISKSSKSSLLLKVKMFCLFQISVPFVSDPTRISRGHSFILLFYLALISLLWRLSPQDGILTDHLWRFPIFPAENQRMWPLGGPVARPIQDSSLVLSHLTATWDVLKVWFPSFDLFLLKSNLGLFQPCL